MSDEQLKLFAEPEAPPLPSLPPPAPRVRPGEWYGHLGGVGRAALWLALVGWVALGVAVFRGWDPIADSRRRGAAPSRAAGIPTLVAVRGPAGTPPAFTLFHRGAPGSAVVLLPAGTILEIPGAGNPGSLQTALDTFGPQGLTTSVANALGIRVPRAVQGDVAGLADLVDALGGVEVSVPETIEIEERGLLRTSFTKGRTRMDGAGFVRFFTLSIPGQQELRRVARQGAAWRGLLEAIARRDATAARPVLDRWSGGEGLSELLVQIGRDRDAAYLTLPVRRVGVSGTDLYSAERSELGPIRAALRDVGTVTTRRGHRVRLLIGADGALGPAVARPLIDAGFVIVLSGRASRPYDVTRVVMAENTEAQRRQAERIVGLLGMGRLGLSKAPQTLVDVTLVVGRDWARAQGFVQSDPKPTSKPRRR